MGLYFSCPLSSYSDIENTFQSIIARSISFANNDDSKTPVRSITFKGNEPNSKIFQNTKSQSKMTIGHLSLKRTENEANVPIESLSDDEINLEVKNQSPRPKHEAALKLQKVYKSFRTRRKLADCAVLIEQSWWKLLDFAELKQSSISFFEIGKPETAASRWSRARTRAAKVGKGLSKNTRAQKLALQHWLEAIDPRHRYGHNLHFYYVKWLHSQSKEPFFYWLDIGEGKEVNLVDKCSRSKLQLQCIKYLGPTERMSYEVIVEDGKFVYKQSREVLDTRGEPKGAKWIFVLSASMNLYVGKKKKGTFQHSSFLAGGATSAAGRIVVEDGMLKAVWPHSGHYRPTPENFQDFISFLKGNSVDLTDVKMDPDDDEEELSSKSSKVYMRSMSSEEDLFENNCFEREEINSNEQEIETIVSSEKTSQTSQFNNLQDKPTNLLIPDRDDLFEEMKFEDEGIAKEAILTRISSHKETNSYQLGKQLSCKWTTGAGPRIGCLRDYPPKLQSHCLEKTNLSPRSSGTSCLRSMSSLDSVIKKRLISFSGEFPGTCQGNSQNSPLSKGYR